MNVVLLGQNDLKQVVHISQESFGPHSWTVEQYEENFLNNLTVYFGLWLQEELIGFCHWQVLAGEAELLNIAVLPHQQGHHYGEYLLQQSMIQLNAKRYLLEVRSSNERALKLYKKIGFKPLTIRKNYYHAPVEDAIVMEAK